MAELKTKETKVSVDSFLKKAAKGKKLEDAYIILEMMKKTTGQEPKMWGPSIVGFGKYHYKYASGREGDMCAAGFSPRKNAMTIYINKEFKKYTELMKKLGKHKMTVSCLCIKDLDDVDLKVLKQIISESYKYIVNKKW